MSPDRILLYCRAGFESECAQEIMDLAVESGGAGYVRAHKEAGYVEFVETMPGAALAIHRQVPFERLIFARQWFLTNAMIEDLPERNRVEPLVARYRQLGVRLAAISTSTPCEVLSDVLPKPEGPPSAFQENAGAADALPTGVRTSWKPSLRFRPSAT